MFCASHSGTWSSTRSSKTPSTTVRAASPPGQAGTRKAKRRVSLSARGICGAYAVDRPGVLSSPKAASMVVLSRSIARGPSYPARSVRSITAKESTLPT